MMILCKTAITFALVLVSLCSLTIQLHQDKSKERSNCTLLKKAGNGFFIVPANDTCKSVLYEIEANEKSSIIRISSSPHLRNNESSSTRNYPNSTKVIASVSLEWARKIVITFMEMTLLENGTNFLTPIEEWNLTPLNFEEELLYISRSRHVYINATTHGNWIEEGVKLLYEELPFDVYSKESAEENGVIHPNLFMEGMKGRGYRPHSASLFQIKKSQKLSVSSIAIILDFLDIDEGIGEYLLIGAGDKPLESSPPIFISNNQNKKKIYMINDENAYIIFVAGSTRRFHKGYNLTWRHNGTKITIEEEVRDGRDEDILQSIQVCIYNYSAALNEFQKPLEDRFINFREELTRIAAEQKMPKISPSQISFYRISAIVKDDKSVEEGLLYVMLKIQGSEKGTTAFKRPLLQKLFDIYNSSYEISNYRIGKCPTRKVGNFGFYAMIPIFCCIFIFIWTWKQNPLSAYFRRKNVRKNVIKLRRQRDTKDISAEDNIYSTYPHTFTVPKMHVTDDLGRRFTLNYDDTMKAYTDDRSEIEEESMYTHRRQDKMQDTLNMRPSSQTVSTLKAEINEAFEDEKTSFGNSITITSQDSVTK